MGQPRNLPKPLFVAGGEIAVLLLHAYSGSSNDVRMLSRFLEKQGYTVYAPHFSGHGTLRPEDILAQSVAQFWQDTCEAYAFLTAQGYQKIAVFGLSMGGIFATRLLTEQRAHVLGGGFFCSPIVKGKTHVVENFLRYAEQVLTMAQLPKAEQQTRLTLMKPRVEAQLAAIEAFAEETENRLAQIQVPCFFAQAGADEMIDPTGVYQVIQKVRQTRYTLQWYPTSTHVITVGSARKQLQQDVAVFLQTLIG